MSDSPITGTKPKTPFPRSAGRWILRDHYQVEIKGGEQRLKAIPASGKISKYLKIKNGEPVLNLERKMETSTQGLFIYSSIYCNTEKYAIFGTF